MRYPSHDLTVDHLLLRDPLNRLQRSLLRFHFGNLFMKLRNLGLVIRDLLIEDFLLSETFFLLVFELIKLPFTSLTGISFDLCLVEFRVYLEVNIVSKVRVLSELSEEILELDKILHH